MLDKTRNFFRMNGLAYLVGYFKILDKARKIFGAQSSLLVLKKRLAYLVSCLKILYKVENFQGQMVYLI
jgi:hypothetical protein